MFWNPKIECMPTEDLKALQYRELKQLVNNLYSFNKFYHDRMVEHKVHPDDITCLKDIAKLPFMYKQDLRDNYPTKMFTVPNNEIVRYHVSSSPPSWGTPRTTWTTGPRRWPGPSPP